jgi:hypothetical protein
MQKLLRTSLFSLFALILATGMSAAPAQAQDILIDADDNQTINDGLDNAQDGDVVRIVASEYDENVVIGTATTDVPAGGSLTIQATEDTDAGDSDVRIGQLAVEDNIELTVERPSASNPGFFNIEDVTTPTSNFELELAGGTFTVDAPDVLEVFDGAQVRQAASASLSGNGPAYDGDAAVEIEAGSGSLDLTSGPTILPEGDVELNVEGSGSDVTFPSGLAVNEVSGDAPFGNPDVLDVGASVEAILNGGTVTGSTLNDGTITADGSVDFDAVTNNGTLTANATLTFGGSVDNSGTLTANAALTFNAGVTNSGLLTLQHSGETSSYDAGTALVNTGGSGIEIEDGSTFDVAGSGVENNEGILGAGTLEVSGNLIEVTDGGPNEILADNSGSGGTAAGTIVAAGATTFQDAAGSATAINFGDLDANASVTLNEGGSPGSGIGEQTVGDIVAKNTGTVVDFFNSSTSDVTTGSIETQDNAEVLLSNIGATVSTGALTANANSLIDFNGTDDVRISGTITANGGADTDEGVNLFSVDNTAEITGDVTINSGGNVDIGGSDVDLQNASLTQNSSGQFQTNDATAITLSGDADDILDHNTLTTIGELTFNKSNSGTPTLGEAIEVSDASLTGDVTIDGNAALQDNVILSGDNSPFADPATFEVSGTIEQQSDPQGNPTFLIFDEGDKEIRDVGGTSAPSGIENIRVDGGVLTIGTDVVFERKLEMLGGFVLADQNDLIPKDIEGDSEFDLPRALVERDLSASGGVLDGSGSFGSFNGADNPYDLTYFASSTPSSGDAQGEFNRNLQNLTIESGTLALIEKPQLVESGVVNGTLDIQSDAKLTDDDNDAPRTLVLEGSNASIIGSIEEGAAGGTANPVTLETRTDGTTITGSTDNANEARIDNLTVAASNVAIESDTPLQQIDGDVFVQEGSGLELALVDAQGSENSDESGTDDDNDGTDDRTIEGTVTVNGALALSSTVETVNENGLATSTPAVTVNDGVTSGTLDLGSSDLVFTGGSGAALLANSDNDSDTTPFSSNGGALVFDNNASNSQRIAASGEAIPRIKIEESNDGRFIVGNGSTNGDFKTTVQLDADEEIDLNGNTVEVSGVEDDDVRDVELAADIIGSGDFRVVGTTVTAQTNLSISNFTVDSGSGNTVTLQSIDPDGSSAPDAPFTVAVPTAFELASGSLEHGDTNLQIGGTFAYTGSGSPETEIEATDGFVDLNNDGLQLSLDNAVRVSNLRVSESSGLANDGVNLTVGNELELDDGFGAASSEGSVVMADGATVQRLDGTSEDEPGNGDADPLAEQLATIGEGQYNVVYGGPNTTGNKNFDSSRELVSGQIDTLRVSGAPASAVHLREQGSLSGDVVVNALDLESGTLDYSRQLQIADEGAVFRTPNASLADATNDTEDSDSADPAPLAAAGTFALEYEGDDGSSGGTLTASELEFTSDVSSVETSLGDAAAGNDQNASISFDRTVSSLTVDNETDGSQTDVGGTLTVEDDADVTGGDLIGSGTVDLTGESSVFTADGSGVTINVELSLANELDVENEATVDATVDVDGPTTLSGDGELFGTITSAGDITVDSGSGTLGDNSTSFTFDGAKDDQAVSLNGADAEADSVTMAKSNESPVPQTTVSGGNVVLTGSGSSDVLLDLNNGVLAVEGDVNAVDLGEGSFERESDSSFDPTQDTSHVAGNIVRTIGGTGVGGGGTVGDRIDVTYPVGSDNAAYRPIQFIFDQGNAVDDNDLTAGHTDPAPTPSNNLPLTTETGVTIGTDVPNFYWRAETDENLGIGQENDFEIAVTTGGLDLVEPLADHRILRQEEDDGAPYSIQGTDGQYDNSGTASSAIIRNEASTGGLSPEGRRFTVGVPQPPAPTFTDALTSPQTVAEGDTLSGDFAAEVDENSSGSVEFAVDAPSAIEDSVDIGTSSGELSYRPGFDDTTDSPYDLTIEATDTETGAVADSVISVEVQNTGVPPAFAKTPSDRTVAEGDVVSANFEATTEDPASASDAIEFAVSVDPSTVSDSVTIDETGEVRFATNLDDAADSPYTLTVTATDTDAQTTADASFEVAVNDDVQPPVFVDGSRPSDFTPVARDTSRESTSPTTIDVTAQVEDPSSAADQLGFETDVDWASVTSTSTSGDQATATIALEPGFEEAKSAAESNDSLDVSVTATDGATGEPVSETVSVNVRFNPFLGDADGLGSAYSANDAFAALAIAVGKSEIEQGGETFPLLDGHVRAADVSPPTEGDTLDANTGDVNAFDALRILQGPPEDNGGATVAAQASARGQSAGGAIQIGEVNRKDGMATVPVRLSGSASNVQAADLKVTLTDEASVEDVQASTPGGWISSYNVSDEGVLTVGMAGTNALSGGQKIATVRLDATGNGQPFTEGTYQLNGAGEESFVVETTPSEFALDSNYPNPVQTSTTIEYKLKEARSVTMEVYNTLGQKVATLVDEEKEAGSHSVSWEAGNEIASGVYFYRIEAGDFTETKRITVVR